MLPLLLHSLPLLSSAMCMQYFYSLNHIEIILKEIEALKLFYLNLYLLIWQQLNYFYNNLKYFILLPKLANFFSLIIIHKIYLKVFYRLDNWLLDSNNHFLNFISLYFSHRIKDFWNLHSLISFLQQILHC